MHCTFVNYAIVIANYFDSVIANSIKSSINRLSCRKYIFLIAEIHIFFFHKHSKTYVQMIKAISTFRFAKEPVAIIRVTRSLKRKYLTRKLHRRKVALKLETRVFCMRINEYTTNTKLNDYSLLPVNWVNVYFIVFSLWSIHRLYLNSTYIDSGEVAFYSRTLIKAISYINNNK